MADNGTTSHDLAPGTLFAHITENLKGTVGLQALIIDDLEAWLPFSTKDRPKVRQFLNELHTTAKHFQIAILLITHTAEGGRKHAIRPAGAELLLSAPRLAYTILPAPTDTDPTRRCLRLLKSNIPIPTPDRLFYSLNSDQSLTWDAAPVPQPNSIKTPAGLYLHQPYCVHGQAEAEAADRAHRHQQWTEVRAARIAHKAANPPPPRPCPMVNESMRLLTERLRREPLPASELLNLCSAHRISPKTTYIAKDKLRITAETVTPTQATTPAATPSDLSTHPSAAATAAPAPPRHPLIPPPESPCGASPPTSRPPDRHLPTSSRTLRPADHRCPHPSRARATTAKPTHSIQTQRKHASPACNHLTRHRTNAPQHPATLRVRLPCVIPAAGCPFGRRDCK